MENLNLEKVIYETKSSGKISGFKLRSLMASKEFVTNCVIDSKGYFYPTNNKFYPDEFLDMLISEKIVDKQAIYVRAYGEKNHDLNIELVNVNKTVLPNSIDELYDEKFKEKTLLTKGMVTGLEVLWKSQKGCKDQKDITFVEFLHKNVAGLGFRFNENSFELFVNMTYLTSTVPNFNSKEMFDIANATSDDFKFIISKNFLKVKR